MNDLKMIWNKLRLKMCQTEVQFNLESGLVGLRFVKFSLKINRLTVSVDARNKL